MTYPEFLKTDFWQALRWQCYRRDNLTCQNCGRNDRQMHAHHRIYRGSWFETRLGDLVTLCEVCHKEAHRNRKQHRHLFRLQKFRTTRRKRVRKFKRKLSLGVEARYH